jgi:hypothetical protein
MAAPGPFYLFLACNIAMLAGTETQLIYVAQYCYCTTIDVFVTLCLSLQLIARMTKHGWFDGDKKVFVFRDILDEAGKFLRVRNTHTHTNC